MTSGMDDILGSMFGGKPGFEQSDLGRAAAAARKDAKRPVSKGPTALPQIRGKQIDGTLYVRASDVADALEATAPKAAQRLINKLRKAA